MNIDFNPYVAANRPISSDFDQMQEVDAAKYEQVMDSVIRGPSLVVTDSLPGAAVDELEFGNDNPVRDDDLGILVKSAFDLKPPEVPDFV
jgi:hypothetical protein